MNDENEILWTAAFLNERFTSVVSPLGWSFVGALFEQLALRDPLRFMGFPDAEKIPATRLWHGHPYVNVALFQIFYKPFPNAFVPADAVRYFPNGDVRMRKRASYPTSILQPRFVLSLAYHLLRDPVVTSPFNFLAWNQFTKYHDARIRALQARLGVATNAQQVLRVLDATYALDTQLLHLHRWSLTYADLFYKLLAHFSGKDAQRLMSHAPNKTQEVNAALAALARLSPPPTAELLERIAHHESLAKDEKNTARALQEFLAQYGHRAFSLDIAQPTYRDDPTLLLPLLSEVGFQTKPVFLEKTSFVWNPVIALARRYAQLREDQRYYWQKSLALTRAAFLVLGRDLAARGIVHDANEIFYATRAEITAYYGMEFEPGDFSERIAARKREWQTYQELDRARGAEAYPLFLRGDVPLKERATIHTAEAEWRGRGVSAGIARGIARIVREPRELARVGAGEILIAPATDPAWTPVFARLAGLVMERGGVLSHGAVIAREYHLPAVTAIPNLMNVLEDGARIQIDGTTGIVKRL